MDATTWSSRRRPQPCLLSRCSSCYRARSYSQLWVTAMDPSGSHCSLLLPCLFMETPTLCLSSGHCLCCTEPCRIFQRVSDATFACLQSYPLIAEELWDSELPSGSTYLLIWPVDIHPRSSEWFNSSGSCFRKLFCIEMMLTPLD